MKGRYPCIRTLTLFCGQWGATGRFKVGQVYDKIGTSKIILVIVYKWIGEDRSQGPKASLVVPVFSQLRSHQ